MDREKTVIICLLLLMSGAGITAMIFFTEPTAKRTGATRETAMLVEVTEAQRGTFRPEIVAMGTVEPAQEIVLSPRVAGELVERAPSFTPGGLVQKGETLLRIDPSDYRNRLRQRESDLRQALAELNLEKGRQDVARLDYELLDEKLSAQQEALMLREPQLDTAQARVEAARAALAQAKLDLERTNIKAPFDAQVLSREVNVGSQVSPGDRLGQLAGLDTYWVVATLPLSKLRWISFPEKEGKAGSPARIHNHAAWPEGVYRTGRIDHLVGALEEPTRLARILISISDPLALESDSAKKPPLIIGAFVEARIQADEIEDVVRLNRDFIRKDNTVWVMEDGRLRIRSVDLVFQDAVYAYIENGLQEGERVVTTNLATVTEGARLRLKGSGTASGKNPAGNEAKQVQDESPPPGGAV